MKLVLIAALLWGLAGCVEPGFEQVQNGARYKVELYSDGKLVREWFTAGTVGRTNGVYHFADEDSGATVYVTKDQGTLVVTSVD